jgi:prepilin-type N-terminal cleavage/methylation domain-containing protein
MRANRGGFTLVEVLVGLTVAALALSAGFAALAFVGDRAKDAEVSMIASLSGATARSQLVDWVTGARLQGPNRAGTFQGSDVEEQGLANDELVIPTTARTPLRVRNSMVRLYIDRDDETPERGLVAELWERQQDEPKRVELVPQAAELDVHYLPDVTEAIEWQPSWVGQNQLPRAIEIVIQPEAGDSLPALLRFPIRIALATLR